MLITKRTLAAIWSVREVHRIHPSTAHTFRSCKCPSRMWMLGSCQKYIARHYNISDLCWYVTGLTWEVRKCYSYITSITTSITQPRVLSHSMLFLKWLILPPDLNTPNYHQLLQESLTFLISELCSPHLVNCNIYLQRPPVSFDYHLLRVWKSFLEWSGQTDVCYTKTYMSKWRS